MYKQILFFLISILVLFVISACTTPIKVSNNSKPLSKTKKIIEKSYFVDEKLRVAVGETILQVQTGPVSKKSMIVKDAYRPENDFSVNLKGGSLHFYNNTNYYSAYVDSSGTSYINNSLDGVWILYIPISKKGYIVGDRAYYDKYQRPYITASIYQHLSYGKLYVHRNFKFKDVQEKFSKFSYLGKKELVLSEEDIDENKFLYKLTYGGKFGDNITVMYSEFHNDLIKPAYSKEYTYNLADSNILRFKNIRMKVIIATNEMIEIVVLED